jgi:hypothetical protein
MYTCEPVYALQPIAGNIIMHTTATLGSREVAGSLINLFYPTVVEDLGTTPKHCTEKMM